MGIDRLMMTLTGLGIRETILFPLVRPIILRLRWETEPEPGPFPSNMDAARE